MLPNALSSALIALYVVFSVLPTSPPPAFGESPPRDEIRAVRNPARASLFQLRRGRSAAAVKVRNAQKLRALKRAQGADAIEIEEIDDGIRRLQRQSKEYAD